MPSNFPKIRRFGDAQRQYNLKPLPSSQYLAKIKLHGTNGTITCNQDGEIEAYSKRLLLTSGGKDGNQGFYEFSQTLKGIFNKRNYSVVGEWCGKGIGKGTGINSLETKMFFPFLAVDHEREDKVIIDVDHLKLLVKNWPNTVLIPFAEVGEGLLSFDILNYDSDFVNNYVEQLGQTCSFTESLGLKGGAEGLVFYPKSKVFGLSNFCSYCFKAKAEQFSDVSNSKPIREPISESDMQKVINYCTINRFEQISREFQLDRGVMHLMGEFIKQVNIDIKEEFGSEFSNWSKASKEISKKARAWFQN